MLVVVVVYFWRRDQVVIPYTGGLIECIDYSDTFTFDVVVVGSHTPCTEKFFDTTSGFFRIFRPVVFRNTMSRSSTSCADRFRRSSTLLVPMTERGSTSHGEMRRVRRNATCEVDRKNINTLVHYWG